MDRTHWIEHHIPRLGLRGAVKAFPKFIALLHHLDALGLALFGIGNLDAELAKGIGGDRQSAASCMGRYDGGRKGALLTRHERVEADGARLLLIYPQV